MPPWLQITFRNIDASPAVEAKIRERARELEQFFVAVTALEGKDVRILGWHGRSAALQSIRQHRYREQEEWP